VLYFINAFVDQYSGYTKMNRLSNKEVTLISRSASALQRI